MASEIFSNGGLEDWTGIEPDNWTVTLSGGSLLGESEDAPYAGNVCAQMEIDGSNNPVSIKQTVTLTASRRHKFQVVYRNSAASKTAKIAIYDSGSHKWLDSTGAWQGSETWISLANSTDWLLFQIAFVPHPSYTAYIFELKSNSAASSSIFWDAASVMLADEEDKLTYHEIAQNLSEIGQSGSVITLSPAEFQKWKDWCVNAGKVDANGLAAFLAAGTGLSVDVDAQTAPLQMTIAGSYVEFNQNFSIGVEAYRRSYLWVERPAEGLIGFGKYAGETLVKPKFGYTFASAPDCWGSRCLLHFDGADASTTITDEAGYVTWACNGNAQLDTAQKWVGTASLLLDGAGDYVLATGFPGWPTEWTIDFRIRVNALPSEGVLDPLFGATGAQATAGVQLSVTKSGGVGKLELRVSSNGSSWDVSAGTLGIATISTGTWYHVAVVFNPDVPMYRVYVDGVTDISVYSGTRAFGPTTFALGRGYLSYYNGWIDEWRFGSFARWNSDFTPPASAYTSIVEDDEYWFDMSVGQMKRWDGSAWQEVDRVFLGEVVTDADSVIDVVSYALNRRYVSGYFAVGAGTQYEKSHNLGIPNIFCIITVLGYQKAVEKARQIFGTLTYGATLTGFTFQSPTSYHRHAKIKTNGYPVSQDDDTGTTTAGYYNILAEGLF